MSAKHTPGPWTTRVNPTSGYGLHLIEAHNGEDTIATQVHPCNATLLAAAPDLLAALQFAVMQLRAVVDETAPPEGCPADALHVAEDALAKAVQS